MAGFKLGGDINSEKIFLVNRSEIVGRIDPNFYTPSTVEYIGRVVKSKYAAKKLREITYKVVDGPFGTQLKVEDYQKDGVPVIRVSNVRTGEITTDNLVRISPEKHKSIYRSRVLPGNVLLTKAGAILGYSAVFPLSLIEGNITSHLVAISCKETIDPHYLKLIFQSQIGQRQIYRWGNKSTRPELNTEETKEIIVPVPPLNIQNDIVKNYNVKNNQKQQKEAEAQQLLDSIDGYLLHELGITLPEVDNSLESRMFQTSYSNLTGDRHDPKLYDKHTANLRTAITDTPYITMPLKGLVTQSVAGDWGKDENEIEEENYIRCLVIRATEFDNIFNLNLDNSRVKYRMIHATKLAKLDVQAGDLLIEKSGGSIDQPVGRVSILTQDILTGNQIAYSNFIHKIRIDSTKVVPEYLFCFLRTMHNIKLTEAMQSQTNGIRNLIMRTYLNQNIVLPSSNGNIDLKRQKEIASHIQGVRNKARQLQEEAKQILEGAKQEVERMILGEK